MADPTREYLDEDNPSMDQVKDEISYDDWDAYFDVMYYDEQEPEEWWD